MASAVLGSTSGALPPSSAGVGGAAGAAVVVTATGTVDDEDEEEELSGLAALAGYGSSSDSEDGAAACPPAEVSSKPLLDGAITTLVQQFHAASAILRPSLESKLQAAGVTVGLPGAAYLWTATDGRNGEFICLRL